MTGRCDEINLGTVSGVLRRVILCGALATVLAVAACQAEEAAPGQPGASRPSGTAPAGPPPVEQGRWWTWVASEPSGSSPVGDRTGEFCGRNQPGDVWFLAGTFGGAAKRRCPVPAGRPILVPAVNLFSDDPADCEAFMRGATGTARLDGGSLTVERIDDEQVSVDAAEGNGMDLAPGRREVTACGLWVRLGPLEPGQHQLRIEGRSGAFSTAVDYVLDVSGPA